MQITELAVQVAVFTGFPVIRTTATQASGSAMLWSLRAVMLMPRPGSVTRRWPSWLAPGEKDLDNNHLPPQHMGRGLLRLA